MTQEFFSRRIQSTALSTLILLSALGGCNKQNMIPNTKIADTSQNRDIIEVVENYRKAMERLDAASILSFAHPTYLDNSGTPEGSDDLDYQGLKKVLTNRFKRTKKIHYRIEYQEIHVKGNEAEVDAYIDATFVYEEPKANPRWRRLTDYNRFRLLRDGASWRFISGL